MSEPKINEYVFALSGKASIPEPLEMDSAYSVLVDCEVVGQSDESNQDGTVDRIFKAKFIRAIVADSHGKSTKTRDARKKSQQMRAVIRQEWKEKGGELTEEEYYNRRMDDILDKLIEGTI